MPNFIALLAVNQDFPAYDLQLLELSQHTVIT